MYGGGKKKTQSMPETPLACKEKDGKRQVEAGDAFYLRSHTLLTDSTRIV